MSIVIDCFDIDHHNFFSRALGLQCLNINLKTVLKC